ncbi:hypothetical protein BU16DRAFT_501132 [Lophium mytilinum]|uniref:Zn(2)-C6 fungal-type domain-containing protein n=1 Tax=Lophium mytilinum TaxID=390894 RepID=A0A6A6RAD4_9PEZI|nr:hypothetical protein BU16DRAFT_501132 [Lophium mytilinum]
MMSLLGPLDKRLLVRRCKACQRRKIKCSMPTPCTYCVRTCQPCEPASGAGAGREPRSKAVVFTLPQTGAKPIRKGGKTLDQHVLLSPTVYHVDLWPDSTDQHVSHFFDVFLAANDFSGTSWRSLPISLSEMIADSSALKDVAIALAALDCSRRPHSAPTAERGVSLRQTALSSYSRALQEVRVELSTPNQLVARESTVWVTFFLGIFELMLESNEKNWEKHFLYGTSHLLQVQGPKCCGTGRGRERFLALRIFEISRALIYQNTTFLAEPEWLELAQQLKEEDREGWYPKEAMYDLMLSCSVLCTRATYYADAVEAASETLDTSDGFAVITEGLYLRRCLSDWYHQIECRLPTARDPSTPLQTNMELLIALIYYHALSIFLSGCFDYRLSCFPAPPASLPILTRTQVERHLASILSLTELALNKTWLTGVAFLFPLRVAAARAWSAADQNEVVQRLRSVRSKGFSITNLFEEEVNCLWEEGGMPDGWKWA